MIREHERVVLTVDFPEHGLKAGDVGVVVMVHDGGAGYEVEIFTLDGQTLDVITVEAGQHQVIGPQVLRTVLGNKARADASPPERSGEDTEIRYWHEYPVQFE